MPLLYYLLIIGAPQKYENPPRPLFGPLFGPRYIHACQQRYNLSHDIVPFKVKTTWVRHLVYIKNSRECWKIVLYWYNSQRGPVFYLIIFIFIFSLTWRGGKRNCAFSFFCIFWISCGSSLTSWQITVSVMANHSCVMDNHS